MFVMIGFSGGEGGLVINGALWDPLGLISYANTGIGILSGWFGSLTPLIDE